MPQRDLIQLVFTFSKATVTSTTSFFIVNFQHISHIALVFPLLTLRNRVLKSFALVSFWLTGNKICICGMNASKRPWQQNVLRDLENVSLV